MDNRFTRSKMKKRLAFVLGGGGSRGALQAGALRAILEAGYRPDLLVGTSIGAVNGAYLAMHGVDSDGIQSLWETWLETSDMDLLPANYLWLTVRTLFNRSESGIPNRLRNFLMEHGLTPDVKFGDLPGPPLIVVATDMNAHTPVLYGLDPKGSVLESVVASGALPPWMPVIEKEGKLLVDGGVVSNVPIEAALSQGATEIIALSVEDNRPEETEPHAFGTYLVKLIATVQARTLQLELALAAERGVPVHWINLTGDQPVAIWNFTKTEALLERGYKLASQAIQEWKQSSNGQHGMPHRRSWLARILFGQG